MVVDSSALLAILLKEEGWERYFEALNTAPRRLMAAPSWLEACLVFDNRDNEYAKRRLDIVVRDIRIEVVPFDASMAELARYTHWHYGKGNKHPANLNFGDCMAYALAKSTGEPLLFKGNDFTHTDITPALT